MVRGAAKDKVEERRSSRVGGEDCILMSAILMIDETFSYSAALRLSHIKYAWSTTMNAKSGKIEQLGRTELTCVSPISRSFLALSGC